MFNSGYFMLFARFLYALELLSHQLRIFAQRKDASPHGIGEEEGYYNKNQ
jgi:hypothetical protein